MKNLILLLVFITVIFGNFIFAKPLEFEGTKLLPFKGDRIFARRSLGSRTYSCPTGTGLCPNNYCCGYNKICCRDGCCNKGETCAEGGCCPRGTGICPDNMTCCPLNSGCSSYSGYCVYS